jgi:fluoride ion exporter CrcB/FEX
LFQDPAKMFGICGGKTTFRTFSQSSSGDLSLIDLLTQIRSSLLDTLREAMGYIILPQEWLIGLQGLP